METLPVLQAAMFGYPTAVGVISDRRWNPAYAAALARLPIDTFSARRPFLFNGTLSYLSGVIANPAPRFLREFVRRRRPGHVIIHFHHAWLAGVQLPLKDVDGVKVVPVTTFNGIGDFEKLRRRAWQRALHRWMAQRLLRGGAALTSVDRPNTVIAEELFGIPRDRFSIVPNGVLDTAHRGCPRLTQSGDFTVGFAGSLNEFKGWRLVGDAVANLRREGLGVRFVAAGVSIDNVARWFVAHPGVGEYLGHVANPREVLYPRLDALALPSRSEGMPMVLLEALSAGVPILATRVAGIPDILRDRENGLFVERDVANIQAKIREMVMNADLHRRLSAGARESYETDFSLEAVARRYERVYDQALAARSERT